MRKFVLLWTCLFLLALLAACAAKNAQDSPDGAVPATSTPPVSLSPTASSAEPIPSVSAPPVPSSPVPSATEQEPTGMAPSPSNSAEIYSSYAHMVSFDPARGWADFDYFEMLRGEAAVKWLVEKEGYTQAAAQEEVDNFADSEFIEKNTNPQLRTIDLREIPLKLMYKPDGTMTDGATPIDGDLNDLFALYELDPTLVLDSFFYYIEAKNGSAVSVSQVYWP